MNLFVKILLLFIYSTCFAQMNSPETQQQAREVAVSTEASPAAEVYDDYAAIIQLKNTFNLVEILPTGQIRYARGANKYYTFYEMPVPDNLKTKEEMDMFIVKYLKVMADKIIEEYQINPDYSPLKHIVFSLQRKIENDSGKLPFRKRLNKYKLEFISIYLATGGVSRMELYTEVSKHEEQLSKDDKSKNFNILAKSNRQVAIPLAISLILNLFCLGFLFIERKW